MSDVAAALVGLLSSEGRKPPRVLARLVAEHLEALGLTAPPPEQQEPVEGSLVAKGEPPAWLRFAATLPTNDVVAVTRNRTASAIRALGLDPQEVRAVVIEADSLRVYRWTDRNRPQTIPILKEPA